MKQLMIIFYYRTDNIIARIVTYLMAHGFVMWYAPPMLNFANSSDLFESSIIQILTASIVRSQIGHNKQLH